METRPLPPLGTQSGMIAGVEVKGQRSEVRGQRTEDRGQRTEDRGGFEKPSYLGGLASGGDLSTRAGRLGDCVAESPEETPRQPAEVGIGSQRSKQRQGGEDQRCPGTFLLSFNLASCRRRCGDRVCRQCGGLSYGSGLIPTGIGLHWLIHRWNIVSGGNRNRRLLLLLIGNRCIHGIALLLVCIRILLCIPSIRIGVRWLLIPVVVRRLRWITVAIGGSLNSARARKGAVVRRWRLSHAGKWRRADRALVRLIAPIRARSVVRVLNCVSGSLV